VKILAIDPGVTSGFCYARIAQNTLLEFYPFQAIDDVEDMWDRIEAFKPRYIICEDFEYRSGKGRSGLNLFPVQLIGVVKLYELKAQQQCAVFMQKASTGKSYYNDVNLKAKGFYRRGVPHGMDATRHLLQWFTFGAGYKYNNGNQKFALMLDKWEG
jgi:hypothetical protein